MGRRGESADVPENSYILLAAPPRVRNGHQPQSIDRIDPPNSTGHLLFQICQDGLVVSTQDYEFWDPSSTLGSTKTFNFFFHVKLFFLTRGGAASNMYTVFWNIRTFPPPTHPGHLTLKNPSKSCDKPLRPNPTG